MEPCEYLFSPPALVILNGLQYDPMAKGAYEMLSGGLMWPDEFPAPGTPERSVVLTPWAYRFLIAARAAITLGDEQTGFRPTWDQVVREAPSWPGLRSDRREGKARRRLLAAKRREARCFDEIERQYTERGERGTA